MEGDEDLDILASLLEEDNDDDLMQDDLEPSDHVNDVDSSQCDKDKAAISDGSSDRSSCSNNVDEMSEQVRIMQERIKQLEQQLNERNLSMSEENLLPQLPRKTVVPKREREPTRRQAAPNNKEQNKRATAMSTPNFFGEKKRISHSSNFKEDSNAKASASKTQHDKFDEKIGKGKSDLFESQLTRKKSSSTPSSHSSRTLPEHDEKDVTKEKYSGLRIINPLVSSVVMAQRMEGRKMIPVPQIESKLSKGKDKDIGDWVTIGALVTKLPPKTSANGNTYGIWKLSDLGLTTANDTVALFLFGEVYKQHWKTVEGSVVALLNPSVLPAKEKNSQDIALTLDNPKKMMLMGISKDYGHCKGTTRKDGKSCTNVVNKEYGDFCEYHVNTAYKKIKSNRMEFQSGTGAPSKPAPLMGKLQKDMSSASFMYQGKTLVVGGPAPQKKKNVSLKNLGFTDDNPKGAFSGKGQIPKAKQNSATSEVFTDLLSMPTFGSRNLIKHLHKDEEEKKPKEERIPAASASELLRQHQKEVRNGRKSSEPCQNNSKNSKPMLGRGISPGLDIVFDDTPAKSSVAKLRALSVVRLKGPIEKEDPNAVRKKRSPTSTVEVDKRVEKDLQHDEDSSSSGNKAKRRRLLGPEFSTIDLNSDEGKRLLGAKSLHVGQVKAVQAERQEQYFSTLEKKEQLEEKMKTIKEIEVKVYVCKKCDYIAETASDVCFKDNHPIKKSKAAKRFFACKNCKQRTISYGSRMPKLTCKSCGAMNYERTSMYIEKQGPKIGGETLLVRGEEHGKYLNSMR